MTRYFYRNDKAGIFIDVNQVVSIVLCEDGRAEVIFKGGDATMIDAAPAKDIIDLLCKDTDEE